MLVPSRFRIVRSLGEGGMGVVYEAYDAQRKGVVALKALRNVTPESIARFKREFRALEDVQHPNLVSLGELIFEEGEWFLTMELVEGTDFLSYVRPVDRARGALRFIAQTPMSPTESNLALAPIPRVDTEIVEAARPVMADVEGLDGFDEARLRSSLRQLALGLSALHRAGLVHRDIKPSNIRVTPSGRVVVLDFGLIFNVTSARDSSDPKILGTPAYMAPEQASHADVGPAADWYGVGTMLYEALTGALPFEGAPMQVLIAKQQREPEAPHVLDPSVPADLDALCVAMLRFDPSARPTDDEVLATLHAKGDGESAASASLVSGTQSAPFVGRTSELDELRAAYRQSREGAPVTLFIEGESGVGKTCLVRKFTNALFDDDPNVIVLNGRCYERETVPYKALDGVVDSLGRALARLPEADVTRVLPTRPGPLVQVFPVLRRVEAIAKLPLPSSSAMDPLEVRSRAFAGLRELLARLGELRGLVLSIDDIQWADADSHALLAEILRPPDAPRLLLLATLRTFLIPTSASMSSIHHVDSRGTKERLPGVVKTFTLRKLALGEARELAMQLVERASGSDDPTLAESIAIEADGHPLFIDALARHAAVATRRGEPLRLDDALWASIERLDERSRELMELLAVAGAPIPQNVLHMSATGIDRAAFVKAVSSLRVAHLVLTAGTHETDRIEPYHDRLRTTLLARLGDARRVHHHQRIALAYETTDTNDAQMLATHWRGARDVERAVRYAVVAGDEATRALAFDHAAKLYRRALRLRVFPRDERRALLTKLGFAFANAGRGARAAQAFQEAARGAKEADALELHRRAADQLLRSGHFDEGVAAIRRVLKSVGMKLPSSLWIALFSFVVGRITIALRGQRFVKRDSSQIAARELTLVDICSSAAVGLSLADNIRGAAFQATNLLLALRAGEPYRIARALAFEVAFLGRGGGPSWRRTQRAISSAQSIARESRNPHAIALSIGTAGVAHYLVGRFREGLAMCDQAQTKLSDECADAAWETDSMQLFALSCLAHLGDLDALSRRHALYLREAIDRGDLHAAVNLRIGHVAMVWLVSDEPERSRASTAEAMAAWSKGGFHIEHWYGLLASTQEALYSGNGEDAYDAITARWPALRRSMLRTIQMVRIQSSHLRGRAALAAAEKTTNRNALVRTARRDARAIERERMPWSAPLAKLLRAGAFAVTRRPNDRAQVEPLLRAAIDELETMEMALHAAAARHALGRFLDDDVGRVLVDEAEAWMAERKVARPGKLAAMLVPGFVSSFKELHTNKPASDDEERESER